MLRTALILIAAAATAATPLTWSKKTRTAELSLKLPAAVSHVPVLADRLYRGEIKALEKFGRDAADPKNGQPSEPMPVSSPGRPSGTSGWKNDR